MKRPRKSNRVSWATGGNLCQVHLFLSEDYPSKVGHKLQDHLQVTSSILHSSTDDCIDIPPGFESSHFLNQSKVDFSHISQIKWECPPSFVVRSHWLVAAGEESMEKDAQKLRDMRVLEAVYPRLSDIPPSPYVPVDVREEDYDDNNTPRIPTIPIEEEEYMDILTELAAAVNSHPNVQSPNLQATTPIRSDCNTSRTDSSDACVLPLSGVSSGLDAHLTAASAVVEAIMKSNEQGGLIDINLLVKIFNDPKMVDILISQHGTAATTLSASSNAEDTPTSGLKAAFPSAPFSTSTPDMAASRNTLASLRLPWPVSGKQATTSVFHPAPTTPPAPHVFRSANKHIHISNGMPTALNTQPQPEPVLAPRVKRPATLASMSSSELSNASLPPATGNLHTVVNQAQTTASKTPGSSRAVKDANYYQNLVRQHGAYKQDSKIDTRHSNSQDVKRVQNKQGQVKRKMKPCIYFKSPRGCRNGNDCLFKHTV